MEWEFGKEIETKEDLKMARKFWQHCLLSGYDDLYNGELSELKIQIDNFEKGNKICR